MNVAILLLASCAETILASGTNASGVVNCDKVASSISSSGDCKVFNRLKQCMDKYDWSKATRDCIDVLNDGTVSSLSVKSLEQMLTLPISDIPAKERLMVTIFKKIDWSKMKPADEAFLKAVAKSKEHIDALFSNNSDSDLLANLYQEKNAVVHKYACEKLTKDIVPNVAVKFFENMSVNCFKSIPEGALEGLDQERFAAIKPEVLQAITVKQAEKIPDVAFSNMSGAQARKWGSPYVAIEEDTEANQKKWDGHPCSQAKRVGPNLKKEVKAVLDTHCSIKSTVKATKKDASAAPGSQYQPNPVISLVVTSALLLALFA